jgi:hypothetical protein
MRKILQHFGVRPTLDLFASDVNHVTEMFVSKFYTPGCVAVDATKQDWGLLAQSQDVLWLFPPGRLVSVALSLLEASRLEALVCLPIKDGSNELIQMQQMQDAVVSIPYEVPRLVESCLSSSRVPSGSLNPALLQLGVLHVSWN